MTPRSRSGLIGLAAFAAGIGAGVVAEELLYRRVLRGEDVEVDERFGSVKGTPAWVESFDGTKLYAEVHGSQGQPACVLLHGFTLAHQIWHYQLRDLGGGGPYRTIAYDARGHGRSGPARGPDGKTPFNADTLARDLFAVLHHLEARPAVIVGHSMGGMTIQALLEFVDDYREELGPHVRGLALVNTTFTSALGTWRESGPRWPALHNRLRDVAERVAGNTKRMERLRLPVSDVAMIATRMGFGRTPSRSHVALTRRMIESTPTETLAAGMVGLADFDVHASLEKIDVPVLVCAGDRDILTPVWLAREMARRIPSAELVVFPGTGHMVMLERHEEFTEALRRFCDKVLGGSR